jgi:hypothetical protein
VTHRIIATVGLSFDIVGAVLVGVEAVKLENLRRLRDWTERRRTSVLAIFAIFRDASHAGVGTVVTWLAMFGAVFYGLYRLVIPLRGHLPLVSDDLGSLVLASFAAGWIAFYVTTFPFFLINLFLAGVLTLVIAIVGAIDRNTPAGGVGILGVGALFIGFGLQLAATWLA